MKIDIQYLAEFLDIFVQAETAHISLPYIQSTGFNLESSSQPGQLDEKFLFHLQIALDNGLISDNNLRFNGLESVGLSFSLSGSVTLVDIPIRLTQKGHDFISALNNKEVLAKLKSEFKDAPFKTIFDGSQTLLQHYFKKKIDALVEE